MALLFPSDLKSRILFGFSIILLIMLLVMFWSIYNFYRITQSFKQAIFENYSSIIASDNMNKALDDHLDAIILIFTKDPEAGKENFEEAKQEFYFWYNKARASAYTNEERIVLDSLNIEYESFISNVIYNIDVKSIESASTEVRDYYFRSTATSISKIKQKCYQLFEINHAFINSVDSKVDSITITATLFMLLLVIASIVIGFIFSKKFTDYLVKPLNQLTSSVQKVSEGKFQERIEISGEDDEINNLAKEFNKMSEKLEEYEKINVGKILYERKKFEAIIENINEPVVMIDSNMNLLLANKIFKDEFEIEGDNPENLRSIFKNDSFNKILNILTDKKSEYVKDFIEFTQHSGLIKFYQIIFSNVEIPESNLTGNVVVFRDITKFRELDKLKSEFIGRISHEFKTPLTSMGMGLGMIEDKVAGEITEKQREIITAMKEDYQRLNKLVYDILELTKIENAGDKYELTETNFTNFISKICSKFILRSEEKKIKFRQHIPSEVIIIPANIDSLESAFENILSNALKFTPSGGKIELDVQKETELVVTTISDNGIGIAKENINKIFDKFSQVNDSAPGSIGLGLPIAKEIIELHKGIISVESALGAGTKFIIKLPLAK